MKKRRKAKICDAILDKFRGNKSFDWDALHQEDFYKSIDNNYFEVENIINFLLGQGVNELEEYESAGRTYLRLSKKGFYTISDLREEGYVAKWKSKRRENIWKYILAFIAVSTFILVSIRFYRDYGVPKPEPGISGKPSEIIKKKQDTNLQKAKDTIHTRR